MKEMGDGCDEIDESCEGTIGGGRESGRGADADADGSHEGEEEGFDDTQEIKDGGHEERRGGCKQRIGICRGTGSHGSKDDARLTNRGIETMAIG